MAIICNNCKKIEVCKYTEKVKEFENKPKDIVIPENIDIKYICKYKDNGQIFSMK